MSKAIEEAGSPLWMLQWDQGKVSSSLDKTSHFPGRLCSAWQRLQEGRERRGELGNMLGAWSAILVRAVREERMCWDGMKRNLRSTADTVSYFFLHSTPSPTSAPSTASPECLFHRTY